MSHGDWSMSKCSVWCFEGASHRTVTFQTNWKKRQKCENDGFNFDIGLKMLHLGVVQKNEAEMEKEFTLHVREIISNADPLLTLARTMYYHHHVTVISRKCPFLT